MYLFVGTDLVKNIVFTCLIALFEEEMTRFVISLNK